MNPTLLNLLTGLIFLLALAIGWLALAHHERRRHGMRDQIRERLTAALEPMHPEQADGRSEEDGEALFVETREAPNRLAAWFEARRQRLQTVSNGKEKRFAVIAGALSLPSTLLVAWLLPLGELWAPPLLLLTPPAVVALGYRYMVQRFHKRFLTQFPQALDLIIRAVRAGVPANQAIALVGQEFPEPMRSQFARMGDSLRLGIDLQDVLGEAQARIDIAEFSFFCVCLLLQRETGGPLTETLENLGQIIRARSEMAQKARAMTGEARAASKAMAVIPAMSLAMLSIINPVYVVPLFTTASGIMLLKLALVMVIAGLLVIRHMSDLKV